MNQARKSKIEALRKEAKEDFMRIHQAVLFMYGSAHYDDDADLSGVTLDDLRKFVASLDKDGLEELWQLAEEFEVRDGAMWLDDIQLITGVQLERCHTIQTLGRMGRNQARERPKNI